ncbi:MAG: glycine--tRNA ligase subunit beta [Betaproteobacteria bacterium]
MSAQTLLIELLTEELPPKALARLGDAFANGLLEGLRSRQFLSAGSAAVSYATPRRLAVRISGVLGKSPDVKKREKVLPVSVALTADGQPTAALTRKLASKGWTHLALADFERAPDGKAESLFYSYVAAGSHLVVGLMSALEDTVENLPIPKVMIYQRPDGSDQKFVRPAHRLVALHGADVVPVAVLGLDADRITEGHRFQGKRQISLAHADEYAAKLAQDGNVIAGFDDRRTLIENALRSAAAALDADLQPDSVYAALLDEVTALTENPAVYAGQFEREFLEVPQECLILTMRTNQKYFPLFDGQGKLRQQFLIVSNLRLDDPSRVIEGNERVVRPRLADAKFFYDQDRKTPLADRVARLANVVYHNKLGTQLQRVERLQKLSAAIAREIGADPALAQQAAALAKADLVTGMVGEFPELQGIMGRYYALHDGEPAAVADAIEQHYRPKFAGDKLPEGSAAVCVALADKLDTLAGIYGIGLIPTGDKDAFGLRRHAVGVLRILIEHGLAVGLIDLLELAAARYPAALLAATTVADLHGFILERLRGLLREQGYTANEIEAVLSQRPTRIDLVPARLAAVREFSVLPEAAALAAANKRIQNILRKAETIEQLVDPRLLAAPAEKSLHEALLEAEPGINAELAGGRYTSALKALAGLRGDVDAFFDQVLVNAEEPDVRANRLALLNRLGQLMNQVADISKLAA